MQSHVPNRANRGSTCPFYFRTATTRLPSWPLSGFGSWPSTSWGFYLSASSGCDRHVAALNCHWARRDGAGGGDNNRSQENARRHGVWERKRRRNGEENEEEPDYRVSVQPPTLRFPRKGAGWDGVSMHLFNIPPLPPLPDPYHPARFVGARQITASSKWEPTQPRDTPRA